MTLDARSQMRCAIFVACSTEQHPMMIARIVVFTVAFGAPDRLSHRLRCSAGVSSSADGDIGLHQEGAETIPRDGVVFLWGGDSRVGRRLVA
jgi:hypothetical protein